MAMVALVGGPMAWLTIERTATLFEAVPEVALQACDQDPPHWSHHTARGLEAWALDAATLQPLNPRAPAVPTMLDLKLRAGEAAPVILSRSTGGGALALRRQGNCELVMVLWPMRGEVAGRVGLALAVVSLGALLLALLGGWWLVLRPLFASLSALDLASRSLGHDAYTSPAVDADMHPVRDALDDAHRRILDERSALLQEQARLERHLADAAHDLRTPIAALQLRLERLAGDPSDHDALRGALGDVTTLGLLTENLATRGQLQAGLRDLGERFDLTAVCERVTDRFELLGRRMQIEVIGALPDGAVEVHGSALYAEQVLTNLVHNAVRHHDRAGSVVLQLTPGATVQIEVVDDGPGRPDDLPGARAPGRHGLGLAIVRQLCEHLGWALTFASVEPRGLRVLIVIPPPSDLHR